MNPTDPDPHHCFVILVVVLARMAGRVISCTTQENLPVTEQEAAAAVAAVHDMLGPGQVTAMEPY
jgi:hypothetical protein